LQAVESALENNAKIVIPTGSELVNIIGDMAGVVPFNKLPDKLEKERSDKNNLSRK
jgi:hypothetical protein